MALGGKLVNLDDMKVVSDVVSDLKSQIYGAFVTETVGPSNVVTFTDGADGVTVKSLTVQVGSGVTECKLFVRGRNLWNEQYKTGYYNTSTGNYKSNSSQLCSDSLIPVCPDTTYVFQKSTSFGDVLFYGYDGSYLNQSSSARYANHVFTTPNNCYYININLSTPYGATYNSDAGINYPSTDTTHYAYNQNSAQYDITLTTGGVASGDTANNVVSLLGVNNIWADAGQTTVTYRADIVLYIDKKLSELAAQIVNS